MHTPNHAAPIGTRLAPEYFSPGTSERLDGSLYCSLWAIAYWAGAEYRYERKVLGAEWVRTA